MASSVAAGLPVVDLGFVTKRIRNPPIWTVDKGW